MSQRELYVECLRKQLEEYDMLSSIYCAPGEMKIFDASVISDFNEFLENEKAQPTTDILKAHLDYTIKLEILHTRGKEKLDVRIELPHLYPSLENAKFTVHSTLLGKTKENYLKGAIETYVDTMDKEETYVYQVLSWLQETIEDLIRRNAEEFAEPAKTNDPTEELVHFERLWIYSHHLKSKTKRQEIVRQSRNLDLSGFSRPGKPAIICVEGLQEHTQEFWRVIKGMHWQKISICKNEVAHKARGKIDKLRRFEGFKEQLFCDDLENEEGVMNMGLFLKYLETHNSGYMKKELFGLD